MSEHAVNDLLSYGQQRSRVPICLGLEGTIVAGSYNSDDGTVSVVVGETLANFDDPSQVGMAIPGTLMTPMLGLQAAPQGGERALLLLTRGGARVLLTHGADQNGTDGPGTPVGELWYLHAKMGTVGAGNTPAFDSGCKFTNDGPTPGDGLGGSHIGEQGAHTTADTASGHQIELNDTTQQVKVKTAGGVGGANPLTATFDDPTQTITHEVAAAIFAKLDALNQQITHQAGANVLTTLTETNTVQEIVHQSSPSVKTIVDGAGNAISHVVPGGSGGVVALGDLASNLTAAGKGAINNDILTTFGNNINSFGLANLIQYANLLNSVGAITSGQLTAMLAQLVLSWMSKVGVPAGSSIVKIAA